MGDKELIYSMALTRMRHIGFQVALELYRRLGSGTEIYENRKNIRDVVPDCSPKLQEALSDWDEPIRRAETEMEFCLAKHIEVLRYGDVGYPRRLMECQDAPIVLYYRGSADLNQAKILNIVGTRRCTPYGIDSIKKLMSDLASLCPKVLIISGLAYGIDINAHRQALKNGFETLGVLAHGLDFIYPSLHRETAKEMIGQGGLITEYMTKTKAEKGNFVRRNRIVAGMSDACIVIESAAKGGGLITAKIAQSYSKEVFALPGRITDTYSEGCNRLILDNTATILTSAEDMVNVMGWDYDKKREEALSKGIERDMFPMLNEEQNRIASELAQSGDLPMDILAAKTGYGISKLSSLLFEMEMMGVVRPLAGGIYHLLSV